MTTPDPLAHVRPGDPDPTWPPADPPYCQARSAPVGGYVCTRAADHPGQHLAGGSGGVVCEVWPR